METAGGKVGTIEGHEKVWNIGSFARHPQLIWVLPGNMLRRGGFSFHYLLQLHCSHGCSAEPDNRLTQVIILYIEFTLPCLWAVLFIFFSFFDYVSCRWQIAPGWSPEEPTLNWDLARLAWVQLLPDSNQTVLCMYIRVYQRVEQVRFTAQVTIAIYLDKE